jgi:hypothetical protein
VTDFWDEVRRLDVKRRGRPRCQAGVLKAQWGRVRQDADLIFIRGRGIRMDDLLLLHSVLTLPRFGQDGSAEASFVEELHRRGYDVTTMRFSVRKRENGGKNGQDRNE